MCCTAYLFCWWAEVYTAGPVWALPEAAGQPVPEEQAQEERAVSALPAPGKKSRDAALPHKPGQKIVYLRAEISDCVGSA